MFVFSNPAQKILKSSSTLYVVAFTALLFIILFPKMIHHFILLIGASMVFYSLTMLRRYGELQNWRLEKAKIETLREMTDEQVQRNSGTCNYFYPEITYHYHVNGHRYTSKTVSLERQNIWCAEENVWGEPLTENDKWWSALKVGYELSAYVNPKHPEQSVLIKNLSDSRRSYHVAILSGGILICFLWGLVTLLLNI